MSKLREEFERAERFARAYHELKIALLFPPDGWFVFGTHLDYDGPLEFWGNEGGDPIWERPV